MVVFFRVSTTCVKICVLRGVMWSYGIIDVLDVSIKRKGNKKKELGVSHIAWHLNRCCRQVYSAHVCIVKAVCAYVCAIHYVYGLEIVCVCVWERERECMCVYVLTIVCVDYGVGYSWRQSLVNMEQIETTNRAILKATLWFVDRTSSIVHQTVDINGSLLRPRPLPVTPPLPYIHTYMICIYVCMYVHVCLFT